MKLREVTVWFIILAPIAILVTDGIVDLIDPSATITHVIRRWAQETSWPEMIYVAGVVLLYLHLFRGWPEM